MKQVSLLTMGLVGLFLVCCCLGSGAVCSLAVAPAMDDRAAEIAAMPTTPDVATGKKAALTGTLTGNPAITSDPEVPNIAAYEVVAYQVQTYERSTSGSGSNRRTTGRWDTGRTVVNVLKMDVNGQVVTFYPGDSLSINGKLRVFPEDETATVGSKRVRGFQDGDRVTIVAKHMEDGRFMADELFGGTRDELVSNTRTLAAVLRYGGYALMAMGGVVLLAVGIGELVALRRAS